MTELRKASRPYGEGVDPGIVGIPAHREPKILVRRPYMDPSDEPEVATRETCDLLMVTPTPPQEKPRGRERTGHGFAI